MVPVQLALLNTFAASAAAATHTPLSRSCRLRNVSSGLEGEGGVRPLPLFIPGSGSIFTGAAEGCVSGGVAAPTQISMHNAANILAGRGALLILARVAFFI